MSTGDAAAPEPVRPSERIQALDVLRGFALWGILWVNIQDYVRPVHGRVGMGFAIQLRRAEGRRGSFVSFFLRRMLALFLIGPAEWLWRTMTYGRVQPFRVPAAG